VPLPVPAFAILSVKKARLNAAVQVMLRATIIVPLLQPSPLQPANVDLLAGFAASVMELPLA
jgi:hypothetical protein